MNIPVTVTHRPFGTTKEGQPVQQWIFCSDHARVSVLTYGAVLQSLAICGGDSRFRDVVLGYDTLKEYEDNTCYFGAIVGRCANRIGGASFRLNGKSYYLKKNDGENCLHGGGRGFDRKLWTASPLDDGVSLSMISPDGDENFPGKLHLTVSYRLTADGELSIEYSAVSDQDTVCNLTNHSYFNLNGHGCGHVLDQRLRIDSDYYTPLNDAFVPDGQILSVKNTPFDFRNLRSIGERIREDHSQLRLAGGYDHNFVFNRPVFDDPLPLRAEAVSDESRIGMKMYTTMPGVQLYTPNYPVGSMQGKDGLSYEGRCAFCLETQYFPNALVYAHFPQPVIRAGELYHHRTVYAFSGWEE